jgi:acetyl-CoA synthetase
MSQLEDRRPRPDRRAAPRMGDYENVWQEYSVAAPERFNPVIDILGSWAAAEPDDLALVLIDPVEDKLLTQTAAELLALAERAAAFFLAQGIKKGDRVLVMLPRVPAWYAVVLGAIRIGAVPMPAPTQLTAKDIAYRIRGAGATALATDAAGAAKVEESGAATELARFCAGAGSAPAPAGWVDFEAGVRGAFPAGLPDDPTSGEDPMLLYFTSGTVSMPKIVVHATSYALGHVATARFWHDLRPGDWHWTVSDMGWAKAAWGALFGQWHERATVVQVDMARPTADAVLGILAAQRISSFCAPPTLYRSLILADLSAYDLSALRHCSSAGEPLNPEAIRIWERGTGGLVIHDGYGQTETTALVANFRALPVRPGSMGKPVPGYEVDVVDSSGSPCPPDEVGNIAVRIAERRPVGLFMGYENDSEATEQAFHDGWYFTGDKARRDDDGYFWFEARGDDVITSSAYRIGPFEVESTLVEHPAVAEAAVVGKDDPKRTQIVCAFLLLAPGFEPSPELTVELQEHVKRATAPYKYPREVHYVAELPKTISGKIRRSELRQWLR